MKFIQLSLMIYLTILGAAGRDGTPGEDADDVNECMTNNGGCEDICINTFKGYYCACGIGNDLVALSIQPNCDGMMQQIFVLKLLSACV